MMMEANELYDLAQAAYAGKIWHALGMHNVFCHFLQKLSSDHFNFLHSDGDQWTL